MQADVFIGKMLQCQAGKAYVHESNLTFSGYLKLRAIMQGLKILQSLARSHQYLSY